MAWNGASAGAQGRPSNYTFAVASGFLCEPGSGGCPAEAKAVNGDSYEISGAGTFDTQSRSAEAAGTFNHKSASGNVLETGVWVASEFVSFGSYGVAPGGMWQKVRAGGPPQIGPKRLLMRQGPVPSGGLLVLRILLVSLSGARKTATLKVNCALGDPPREDAVDGIRFKPDGEGREFSGEASGRVIFLSTRPNGSASVVSPGS